MIVVLLANHRLGRVVLVRITHTQKEQAVDREPIPLASLHIL
jgi:hypothetical protein